MKSPFKFLDSYTKDDRDIFFGRDREIEELYHRVFESRIMLVYGISGTGKSSLIHCGLANKFQETDWLPIVVRRGGNINESLAAGIKTASITAQQSKFISATDFKKGVRSLYLDHYKPVFFIFDQFEELFIFGYREERRSFIHIVKSLTESDLQCRMIFVMREEYMAGVTEFEKFIPTFFSNRVRIEKMSHRNALEAIKQPCRVFNIELEEGFAEALLEKLSPGSEEVELTYLQVFLDKIFRLEQERNQQQVENGQLMFKLAMLNKVGNVSDLLGNFLDEQIAILQEPAAAMTILKSLVSIQGTKKQMTADEIGDHIITFGITIGRTALIEMLQSFVTLRILRDKDENDKMEFRHDALAAKVYEKFTLAEKELLEARKYIENAYFNFEKRGVLLNKQDFEYLDEYSNKLILPVNLSDFVHISREKIISSRKALRRITRISTVLFLIILAIALRFYISTQQEVNINELFGFALVNSISDPLKGLSSELDLWDMDSNSIQLHSIILKDFNRVLSNSEDSSGSLIRLRKYIEPEILKSEVVKADISPDRNHIIGWMKNQEVFVYDISRDTLQYIKTDFPIKHIETSGKESLLAVIYANDRAAVYNHNGDKLFNLQVSLNGINDRNLIRFFPGGNNLLAAVNGKNTYIYKKTGEIAYELIGNNENINSIDISPDGRFLVTASNDCKAYIWFYDQSIDHFSITDTLTGHRNKLRSCRFNKTGKYVITASEDSTIRIWDLYGNQINPRFNFLISSSHYRYNDNEPDADRSDPLYAKYYGKFSDALFSAGEHEILAEGFISDTDSSAKMQNRYFAIMFFDDSPGSRYAYSRLNFLPANQDVKIVNKTFRHILASPDQKVGAAVSETDNRIYIMAGTNIITTFSGNNPMFSEKGRTIYWISGNRICRMPFHPIEIRRLLNEYNLGAQSEPDKNIELEI